MTTEKFANALENRVLLFDGAMGTEIQKYDPTPEDFPNNQDGFNDLDRVFYPNANDEESGTGHVVDFLSNGIKIRGDNEDVNDAESYIYMAWAEHPFVSSEGVPCTAR